MKTPLNKFFYVAFLGLGIYHALLLKDYMQAAASLGIGMAFDPFNVDQKWSERPNWQKIILITNMALVAAMFGFGIGLQDR
jgi:ABC-type branched-subunit amino acid transport system permease subunit